MELLNYHHLRYFQIVAHEGNLTRAAEKMNLSQSALSTQIRTLEDRLGHALFTRSGRQLHLTEVGQIALDHADRIFATGRELLATLNRTGAVRTPLRVGALSTLSRNFQLRFLAPVLGRRDIALVLKSGSKDGLLDDLKALALDIVLTTEPPHSADAESLRAHRIDEQPVAIHATPDRLCHDDLRTLLSKEPVILPTESSIRTGFDALTARLGITPRFAAEVDDMAMVRLLTREGAGLAIAPSVVFRDEIEAGRIRVAPHDLNIVESFYAVTIQRDFPHPALEQLLSDASGIRSRPRE